ncbi:MAG TPA: carboxypeptidase-like regulatory domain-containing protein [bacterium]|nr:carboxypeptidase-like regulatory domain-containing protein [bacterium]
MKKNFRIVWLGGAVILLLFFAGCATIINGRTQKIAFGSQPSGADVKITDFDNNTIMTGVTPCKLKLQRGDGYFKKGKYKVIIEKAGYKPFEISITGQASGWYILGNLNIGGFIGYLIIDPASGGMWTLTPDDVQANLQQNISFLQKSKNEISIVLIEDVPEPLKKYMTKISK